MELNKELLEKAKSAETAEELRKLAKAEGVELTAEDAEKAFARLYKSGVLADEELDNVSGGGCNSKYSPGGAQEREEDVVYLYKVGQEVEVFYIATSTKRAVITKQYTYIKHGYYCPAYKVRYLDGSGEDDVHQVGIELP